jgi:hypothetical protein
MKATTRVTITMPPEFWEAVDRKLARGEEPRSAVVRRVLEAAVRNAVDPEDVERYVRSYTEQPQTDKGFAWPGPDIPRQEAPSSPPPAVEHVFHDLVRQWRADTSLMSSAREKALHPAYQRIIGMGPTVLPLLLRELQRQPDHWLWALQAITGEDPSPGSDSFEDAVSAWIQWGKARGLVE